MCALTLFADNVIVYVENPKKSIKKQKTKNLPKTIKWVHQGLKIQDKHTKINLYISNEHLDPDIKITIVPKNYILSYISNKPYMGLVCWKLQNGNERN